MNAKIRTMHEAALRVLEDYKKTGAPFGLFLSSWSFDRARKSVFKLTGQETASGDVQVRIGLERQARYMLLRDELDTVAIYRHGDDARILNPATWPSLSLTNDTWRGQVEELARLSDLIILFWGVTGTGLTEELSICRTGGNLAKTVAIVAVEPDQIHSHQLHMHFPRLVPLNEIPPLPNAMHPEFEPLLLRMRQLRALGPETRAGLVDPAVRLARVPLPATSDRFGPGIWIAAGTRQRRVATRPEDSDSP